MSSGKLPYQEGAGKIGIVFASLKRKRLGGGGNYSSMTPCDGTELGIMSLSLTWISKPDLPSLWECSPS